MNNYYLLSKDIIIGENSNNEFKIVEASLLPLYFKRSGDFLTWLESRSIDKYRGNTRFVKKALRMTSYDDVEIVLKNNALTITDSFWIKPIDSDLKYEDVVFDKNFYSKKSAKSLSNLAFTGSGVSLNYVMFNHNLNRSPELTNIGSFEKCWKNINGKWWMYKKGNNFEKFSEIFIYEFGKLLGFNMAHYEKIKNGVKTLDFTENNKYNFEPAFNFVGLDHDYEDVLSKLLDIAPNTICEYIQMIYLDTLVRNFDRHTFNFGLLRNPNTGDIEGFAPNFDNNNALISRGYLKTQRQNDLMIQSFVELLNAHKNFVDYIVPISEDIILKAISKTRMRVKKNIIIDFIMNGYRQIKNAIDSI